HIHMGGEKLGLSYLFDIIRNTEIPIEQFAPTHLNRDEELFHRKLKCILHLNSSAILLLKYLLYCFYIIIHLSRFKINIPNKNN
ncbi:MAG: hypothetical protein L6305_03235, partial [Actinomycetia bacterium]|nr:hypothetical protein [Actinomycetes bacterium]